jgi:hypothetical protein
MEESVTLPHPGLSRVGSMQQLERVLRELSAT